jgi:hypothetical protein
MAIRKAKAHQEGRTHLTWGTFVQDAVKDMVSGSAPAPKAPRGKKKAE